MTPVDLTKAPPRSPYAELGGLLMLARTIDKLRASLPGGHLGAYKMAGFSVRLLEGLGIAEDDLQGVVAPPQMTTRSRPGSTGTARRLAILRSTRSSRPSRWGTGSTSRTSSNATPSRRGRPPPNPFDRACGPMILSGLTMKRFAIATVKSKARYFLITITGVTDEMALHL